MQDSIGYICNYNSTVVCSFRLVKKHKLAAVGMYSVPVEFHSVTAEQLYYLKLIFQNIAQVLNIYNPWPNKND